MKEKEANDNRMKLEDFEAAGCGKKVTDSFSQCTAQQ